MENNRPKGKKILGMDSHDTALFMRRYGIGLVLVLMILALTITSRNFLTLNNIANVLSQVAINGILAFGMVFVITAGGIDLSVGSMLAMSSITIGMVLNATQNDFLACVASVALCAFFGLINGILIAKFNMIPFVGTLATQLIIRGIGYVVSGGYSFALGTVTFKQIGLGKLWGVIPYPIFFLIIVAVLSFILLHNTRFGRYIYAVGGNQQAARASGVNVVSVRLWSFVISGICAGIAGIIMTSRISAAQPNIGIGYETDAIAACVIGGTSFNGGIATIPGTFIGIAIIGLIYNGMNLLGVGSYWQDICKGLLIIVAVLMDMAMNKRRS